MRFPESVGEERRSLRSHRRLNRDNPGERAEHTSVSGIIALFRSKPRGDIARSLAVCVCVFRAIPLGFPPRARSLLLRFAYFLPAEAHHHRGSFFPRQKQFRAVESIDRTSKLRERGRALGAIPPRTLRSYVSSLLPSILFHVPLPPRLQPLHRSFIRFSPRGGEIR